MEGDTFGGHKPVDGAARDILEERRGGGGVEVISPSRAPSLCPATVLLMASASFNGFCFRQEPPPTAWATSSNSLSNRFWGRL